MNKELGGGWGEVITVVKTSDNTNEGQARELDKELSSLGRENVRNPDRDPYCLECGWVAEKHGVEDTACAGFQQRYSLPNRRAAVQATRDKG